MKISGSASLAAPVDEVWRALNDPAVLVRTIPGCERLEETGPDRYRMTITAGVASIKGTYEGEVALAEQRPPSSFVLKAAGAGAPGTVDADVTVTLSPEGDGTRLVYDADAIVGGMVGGVGQRMLTGVAKKTAGEFFRSVDQLLANGGAATNGSVATSVAGISSQASSHGSLGEAGAAHPPTAADDPAADDPAAGAPRVFTSGRASGGAAGDPRSGMLLGAGIALLGVVVGAVTAGVVGGILGRRRN